MRSRPRSLLAVALACCTTVGTAGAGAGASPLLSPAPPAGPLWPASVSEPPGIARAAGPRPALSAPVGESTARRPAPRAWIALGAGVALTAASFALAESADDAYADYLGALDPGEIERHYDRATRLDRWATASLLAGQLGLALGLYWALVRRPPPAGRAMGTPGVAVAWTPADGPRVALALRF